MSMRPNLHSRALTARLAGGLLVFALMAFAIPGQCYEISPDDSSWVFENLHMIRIPSGSFVMGSEDKRDDWLVHSRPLRRVYVDSFEIGAYEVTQALFEKVMGFNPSLMKGDSRRPVDQASWFDAAQFCNRLSELAGFMPAYDIRNRSCIFSRNGFRLPTEAEWEYVCRAGSASRYYSGDEEVDLERVGWYKLNSEGTTHPVGSKEPNAWGLFDMHGNVWEWCNDWMENYEELKTRNPHGPSLGNSRVLRGGGWHFKAEGCQAAYRQRARPDYKISAVGFRIVRDPAGRGPLVDGKKRVPGYPYSVKDKSGQD